MDELTRFFEEGGFPMYPLLLLGAAGLALGVLGCVLGFASQKPPLGIAIAGCAVGAVAALASIGGYMNALSGLEAALANVNPKDAETIRFAGTGEATSILVLGALVCAVVLPLAVAPLGRMLSPAAPSALGTASTLVLAAGIALAGFSAAGMWMKKREVSQAMAHYDVRPEDRTALKLAGESEAGPMRGGAAAGGLVALAGVVLLAAYGARRPTIPAPSGRG